MRLDDNNKARLAKLTTAQRMYKLMISPGSYFVSTALAYTSGLVTGRY